MIEARDIVIAKCFCWMWEGLVVNKNCVAKLIAQGRKVQKRPWIYRISRDNEEGWCGNELLQRNWQIISTSLLRQRLRGIFSKVVESYCNLTFIRSFLSVSTDDSLYGAHMIKTHEETIKQSSFRLHESWINQLFHTWNNQAPTCIDLPCEKFHTITNSWRTTNSYGKESNL